MRRILIISTNLMFGTGMESLLSHSTRAQVVGQETDPEKAIEMVQQLAPDVVVLFSDSATDASALMTNLHESRPGLKIIGLSYQDNSIQVFPGEPRMAAGLQDVFDEIDGNDSQPETSASD